MKYIAKFENISMSKNKVDEIEIEQNVEKYLSQIVLLTFFLKLCIVLLFYRRA